MGAANFDFETRCCSNDRWLLARTRCVTVEVERFGKDALPIRRLGHELFAADEFSDFCGRCRTVIGQFAVAQADTTCGAGNKIELMR